MTTLIKQRAQKLNWLLRILRGMDGTLSHELRHILTDKFIDSLPEDSRPERLHYLQAILHSAQYDIRSAIKLIEDYNARVKIVGRPSAGGAQTKRRAKQAAVERERK